ncbi:MAG: alpha/beta fold hydrolase [Acidimicrobiales bacterium]
MSNPPTPGVVPVAVHRFGGAGHPTLFAHATGFHGGVWGPLAAELGDGYECFAFDERGHGNTPPPADGNFDWDGFAIDALSAVDDLGLVCPFGVGHSAGAVALLLAELARPGTFSALFCYEPVIFPFEGRVMPPGEHPLTVGARKRREVFASRNEAFDNFASKPPLEVLRPDALRAYVDYGMEDLATGEVRLKCRGENEAKVYAMSSRHRTYERLAEIQCPVTLAGGELADTFTPDIIRRQAEPLRQGRVEILEGLGHFGPLQDPVAVGAAVRRAFDPPAG